MHNEVNLVVRLVFLGGLVLVEASEISWTHGRRLRLVK